MYRSSGTTGAGGRGLFPLIHQKVLSPVIIWCDSLLPQGLYRIGGVSTKITKLLNMGLDRKKTEQDRLTFFNDEQSSDVLESKTIASALKHYLRNLNEPLMTFRLHHSFIASASECCMKFWRYIITSNIVLFVFRARNATTADKRCAYVDTQVT